LDESQLNNDSLTPLSAGDIVADESGMAFKIGEIKQWEIRLTPVSFARTWGIRSLKFNNTGKTVSGAIKVGVINEGEVRLDFNRDGNFSEEWDFGLPFVLYDPANSGIYDTARVDSDMDLNLEEEQEMTIGGTGVPITVGNKTRNMYLIKADNFDVIFTFNESGRDDWMGTYRKGTNITVPIYSKTPGLKLSVMHIIEDRKRSYLTNYTSYNTTIGADGVGLLTVNIPTSGHYSIQYKITDPNETLFEVPEPWDAPHVQVRSFDTRRDVLMEVNTIPAFTRLAGNASRMMWWHSQGYQREWFNTNGSLLEGLLQSLPANVSGYLTDFWPHIIHAGGRGYALYDRNSGNIFVKNTSNFTGASAASIGEIAYTLTQRYPNRDDPDDVLRNITFTFTGKRCWDDGCQIILGESQPTPTLQHEQTPDGGSRYCTEVEGIGELCELGFDVPRTNLNPFWINNTNSNETVMYIITNVTKGLDNLIDYINRSSVVIAVNLTGQPNNTQTITVSGDMNEEEWCMDSAFGCIGGQYLVNISIVNATYNNGEHLVYYLISEYYNSSDIWAHTAVDSDTNLVGPSSSYYVRYVGWKGVWMALDVENESDLKLYLSEDANFSGETAYREGDDIALYDRWFNDTINFNLLSLTPKNYGSMLINANQNHTFDGVTMWIWDINTTSNGTRFYATDCSDCETGSGNDLWLGGETEMSGLRVRLNEILNATTVNLTIWINSHTARWGYNTDSLSVALNETFYDTTYQKMAGKMTLDGTTYNVVVLDSNSSDDETDFTHVFLSNDTTLTYAELRILGNTTPYPGTSYYLANIDGDRVVMVGDGLGIVGVPYSDDGLGYYISVAAPASFENTPVRKWVPWSGSPLKSNPGRNYTFILYAEDRGDEPSEIGRIMVDDDNLWIDESECEDGSCTCYEDEEKTINESGRIAEERGDIGRWGHIDFLVKNDSTGRYEELWYDIWDRNISEPVRLMRRFDGWWGDYLTNESNITVGLKVIDFLGNPVSGTVSVMDIVMMGEFADEWEHPLSEFNNINYSVSYYGISEGNNTLDSDGVIYITIRLTDNTTWWEGFGYLIELNITSVAGDSEVTDEWFDLGRGFKEGGDSGDDACDSVVNETVCENETNDRCMWKEAEDECVPVDEDIFCPDWDEDQAGCKGPCVWESGENECQNCMFEDIEADCTDLTGCGWVYDEVEEENICLFVGGG